MSRGWAELSVKRSDKCMTRRVAVYLGTHGNRLKESVSHRRTWQVLQLFTYLLTHKRFISCIRRYLVSCTWDLQLKILYGKII